MSEYESVSELVNKTGVSYNEAKCAYEACGGDMLAAIIMLEKAKKANSKGVSLKKETADYPPAVKTAARSGAQSAKELFKKLCGKNVKISGSREYCDLPLPAFVIITVAGWSISLPAMIISLFCGVRYTISGQGDKDIVIGIPQRTQQGNQSAGMHQYPPRQDQSAGYAHIPRPAEQPRPHQYAGSTNPLDSEDKGFFS